MSVQRGVFLLARLPQIGEAARFLAYVRKMLPRRQEPVLHPLHRGTTRNKESST